MDIQSRMTRLLDKDSIRDLLYRYARAADRQDRDGFKTVFWPNAIDDHGSFRGSAEDFAEWATNLSSSGKVDRLVHKIGNILIEFVGDDDAAVESYFTSYHRRSDGKGGMYDEMLVGRYVDHMERRDGQWGIIHRTVVRDWVQPFAGTIEWSDVGNPADQNLGAAKPEDPIYRLIDRLKQEKSAEPTVVAGFVAA